MSARTPRPTTRYQFANRAAAAARAMRDATGCTLLDALRALLGLAADADPRSTDPTTIERIEAIGYLIRCQEIEPR